MQKLQVVWSNDEVALPGDPPGPLEVIEGFPEGGKMPDMPGTYSAFSPDYAPEEMFEVAKKLYKKSSVRRAQFTLAEIPKPFERQRDTCIGGRRAGVRLVFVLCWGWVHAAIPALTNNAGTTLVV